MASSNGQVKNTFQLKALPTQQKYTAMLTGPGVTRFSPKQVGYQ